MRFMNQKFRVTTRVDLTPSIYMETKTWQGGMIIEALLMFLMAMQDWENSIEQVMKSLI